MSNEVTRLRAILLVSLLVSATLFAAVTTIERHRRQESLPGQSGNPGTVRGRLVGKGLTGNVSAGTTNQNRPVPAPIAPVERFLGFDPLAPWVVVAGIAISMLLAAAVWTVHRRIVLIVAALFALALAVLGIRELSHLINQSRPTLVVMTVSSIALDVLVVAIAVLLARPPDPRPAPE